MATYLSDELRAAIERADRHRCAYCWTSEANSGVPLTHDHIQPRSKGGGTRFENLCLACRTCNEFKTDAVCAKDPLTGEYVPLFHPRQHLWKEEGIATGHNWYAVSSRGMTTANSQEVPHEHV